MKKSKNLIILVIILLIVTICIFKIVNIMFNSSTLEDSHSPVIESGDRLSDAEKILKDYGYTLKSIYDDEEEDPNAPDIKTYNYESKNGLISISTHNDYVQIVKYYE
ncbi:hypothetical protein [Paraclostridium bifermentans]|uniref:hypothetical protein n=1 Tax=Paraclostridium bifermentans TaxID=1490 RepID=UPI00359C2701